MKSVYSLLILLVLLGYAILTLGDEIWHLVQYGRMSQISSMSGREFAAHGGGFGTYDLSGGILDWKDAVLGRRGTGGVYYDASVPYIDPQSHRALAVFRFEGRYTLDQQREWEQTQYDVPSRVQGVWYATKQPNPQPWFEGTVQVPEGTPVLEVFNQPLKQRILTGLLSGGAVCLSLLIGWAWLFGLIPWKPQLKAIPADKAKAMEWQEGEYK